MSGSVCGCGAVGEGEGHMGAPSVVLCAELAAFGVGVCAWCVVMVCGKEGVSR